MATTDGEYPLLPSMQERTQNFFVTLPDSGSVVVLCDGDVDGLGAGIVAVDALEAAGVRPERIVPLHVIKGGNAFTPTMREVVESHRPSALLVLDLGVRAYAIAPGVPTMIVDHHRPLDAPPNALVITGYEWDPVPTSSLLTWLLMGAEANAWKAAIGNAGDLGPTYAPFDAAAKAQTKKRFDSAKSLLNSAKRSSDPDRAVPAAFSLLRRCHSAREVLEAEGEDAETLRTFQAEVKAAVAESRRAAPRFSKTEPIALLRFDSPARVHPLLAQSWKGRLPKYAIMAANGGYLPGRVNFSMRTDADINLLDLLARHGAALGIDEPEYGLGHDQATGGSLTNENFARLLASMGFEG